MKSRKRVILHIRAIKRHEYHKMCYKVYLLHITREIIMNIKGMYEDGLYKDIVEYYERTHDLDDVKYVALLCKE